MKVIRRILLAGASLLALTSYAAAEPISIGFFLFAGPLGGVFSFGALVTASQIGLYALGIGISALAGALGRPRQQRVDPGAYKSVFETPPDNSEVNAGGRVGLGGLKIFGNTNGVDRYRLIGHAASLLVATEEYKLGGREVVVDPDGSVASPPYAKPGGSWVNIQTKVGDGTETAWPDLITDFPLLWTSAHRVRGIAQSLVRYTSPGIYTGKFGKMFQGGEPDLTIVARMGVVYDPREPGADPDNEGTYVWSQNGPLWAARIMSTYPDLTMASFDWDFIADEADKADALVATKTEPEPPGGEPRSRFSGVWLSEAKRGDTMQDVLDSVGCEIALSDAGLIRIRLIDDDPTADVAFSDAEGADEITEWNWQSGPEAVERPNICRIKFYSEERNFEMAEIDMTGIAWARIDDEVTRYGEKPMDIELPFCPSASQAQRIARRMFLLARADAGVAITNWVGLDAWGQHYVDLTLTDLDETLRAKIAAPRCDDASGTIEIPFTAWPDELIDSPWNPETMEAAAPEIVPDILYESPLAKPAAPVEYAQVEYPDGDREFRIRFAGVTGGTVAEAIYRTVTGGLPGAWASMTEYQSTLTAGTWYGHTVKTDDIDLAGLNVDTRVAFYNAEDEGSYPSDLFEIRPVAVDNSAPAAPDVTSDDHTNPWFSDLDIYDVELRVVRILVERREDGGAWGTVVDWDDIRPGVLKETIIVGVGQDNFDHTIDWRVSCFTSNGTQGAFASGSFGIPAIIP